MKVWRTSKKNNTLTRVTVFRKKKHITAILINFGLVWFHQLQCSNMCGACHGTIKLQNEDSSWKPIKTAQHLFCWTLPITNNSLLGFGLFSSINCDAPPRMPVATKWFSFLGDQASKRKVLLLNSRFCKLHLPLDYITKHGRKKTKPSSYEGPMMGWCTAQTLVFLWTIILKKWELP